MGVRGTVPAAMFKVECESCKAPYPIDERRVPPTGLKMRCPKCGHSFVVMAPSATSPGGVAPGPARKPNATMLGGMGLDAGAQPPAPPKAMAMPTMVGVAPAAQALAPLQLAVTAPALPAVTAPRAANLDRVSDFPAALGTLDDWNLPAVQADLPATKGHASKAAAAPAKAASSGGASEAWPGRGQNLAASGDFDLDLPVVAADLPASAAGLPAVRAKKVPGAQADLPAIKASPPPARADLPATKTSLPAVRAELPATKASPGFAG